jgi:hypothetical protein
VCLDHVDHVEDFPDSGIDLVEEEEHTWMAWLILRLTTSVQTFLRLWSDENGVLSLPYSPRIGKVGRTGPAEPEPKRTASFE